MTVDPGVGLLWVVGTSFFLAENFDADAPTETGVFGFDLPSGAIVGNVIHYIGQAPAAENVPSQFSGTLAPQTGKTVIRTAPLEP